MSSAVCSLSTRKMKNSLVTSPARSGHCSRVPLTTFVRGRAPVSRVACCTCCCCGRCCCGRCASLRRSVCRSFRFTRRCCRAGRENPSSESSPSSHTPMVDGGGNATRRFLCCLCHSVRLVTAASVASSVTCWAGAIHRRVEHFSWSTVYNFESIRTNQCVMTNYIVVIFVNLL